jgi:hypothetical protein
VCCTEEEKKRFVELSVRVCEPRAEAFGRSPSPYVERYHKWFVFKEALALRRKPQMIDKLD